VSPPFPVLFGCSFLRLTNKSDSDYIVKEFGKLIVPYTPVLFPSFPCSPNFAHAPVHGGRRLWGCPEYHLRVKSFLERTLATVVFLSPPLRLLSVRPGFFPLQLF